MSAFVASSCYFKFIELTLSYMARLSYLDHLKVVLTFLVIFHHSGQAYGDGGEWGYAHQILLR